MRPRIQINNNINMNLIKLFSFLSVFFFCHDQRVFAISEDDTASLQRIIDSSDSTKTIVIPKRSYYINKTLIISSYRTIDFNNAVLIRSDSIFDLIQNADMVNGNKDIKILNLNLIGQNDALHAVNRKHRFSGIFFKNVTNVELKNVVVEGTINNETGAGIYFLNSNNVLLKEVSGYCNDRTAIIIRKCHNITIDGSRTAFNLGSGIAITDSRNCTIKNIVTHDNGYSNLSVNGVNSIVENVISYNAGYSGVNIGHTNDQSKADSSRLFNILSYSNRFEGISLTNSNFVAMDCIVIYGNHRNNLRIFPDSNNSIISRLSSFKSTVGQGLLIEGGQGHHIERSTIFDNKASGIYVQGEAQVKILESVDCYRNNVSKNNGAEITINNASNCTVETPKDIKETLNNYVWVSGGRNNIIYLNNKNVKIKQTNRAKFEIIFK